MAIRSAQTRTRMLVSNAERTHGLLHHAAVLSSLSVPLMTIPRRIAGTPSLSSAPFGDGLPPLGSEHDEVLGKPREKFPFCRVGRPGGDHGKLRCLFPQFFLTAPLFLLLRFSFFFCFFSV